MNAPFLLTVPLDKAARAGAWARARVALIFWWRHGHWPNLDRPRRFTEWVQWRKLNDRDPSLARLTDKLHGKALAARLARFAKAVPVIWSGDQLPLDPPASMPLVVKANHGCNQWMVVRDAADWRRAQIRSASWLARPYGRWLDEWHYGAARRGVLVEPFLGGPDAPLPLDYKVYVFGGRATVIQLHTGRERDHRWCQFDRVWKPLSSPAIAAPAPRRLAEMLADAEALSQGRDFVRVDFYEVDGELWFGEFCLYPGSGLDPFTPDTLDTELGGQWSAARL